MQSSESFCQMTACGRKADTEAITTDLINSGFPPKWTGLPGGSERYCLCRIRPGSPGSTQYGARDGPLPQEWRNTMTKPNAVAQSSARTTKFAKELTHHKQLHRMLTRKSGVTIAQLQKTFGWQPHTARAAISAQRKAGCVVDRLETDKGSVYRIVEEQGTQ